MKVEAELEKLGLSAKEAEAYLALAAVGKATAHVLSKELGFPRSTIYFLVESLQARGIVSTERKRGTSYFVANPPSAFVRMLERERNAVTEKLKAAHGLEALVAPYFKNKHYSVPRVKFVEGKSAVRDFLHASEEEWHRSITESDGMWWGFDDVGLFEGYKAWFNHIWEKYEDLRRNSITVKVFTNVDVAESLGKRFPKTELRPLPSGFDFSSTLWLCGEYLIVIATRRQPHYAFHVKDPLLAENLRVIFSMLWSANTATF